MDFRSAWLLQFYQFLCGFEFLHNTQYKKKKKSSQMESKPTSGNTNMQEHQNSH